MCFLNRPQNCSAHTSPCITRLVPACLYCEFESEFLGLTYRPIGVPTPCRCPVRVCGVLFKGECARVHLVPMLVLMLARVFSFFWERVKRVKNVVLFLWTVVPAGCKCGSTAQRLDASEFSRLRVALWSVHRATPAAIRSECPT